VTCPQRSELPPALSHNRCRLLGIFHTWPRKDAVISQERSVLREGFLSCNEEIEQGELSWKATWEQVYRRWGCRRNCLSADGQLHSAAVAAVVGTLSRSLAVSVFPRKCGLKATCWTRLFFLDRKAFGCARRARCGARCPAPWLGEPAASTPREAAGGSSGMGGRQEEVCPQPLRSCLQSRVSLVPSVLDKEQAGQKLLMLLVPVVC